MTARSAALARNAGHIGDRRECLCAVAGNRRRGVHDRRHAVSIHARACFVRSFLGSTGLGPGASSPPNPRIMTLSAIGDSAARMPAILSSMRKCVWRSSHTAAAFHRRSCPMGGAARTPKCEWHAFPTATSHQRVPQILIKTMYQKLWRCPTRCRISMMVATSRLSADGQMGSCRTLGRDLKSSTFPVALDWLDARRSRMPVPHASGSFVRQRSRSISALFTQVSKSH